MGKTKQLIYTENIIELLKKKKLYQVVTKPLQKTGRVIVIIIIIN